MAETWVSKSRKQCLSFRCLWHANNDNNILHLFNAHSLPQPSIHPTFLEQLHKVLLSLFTDDEAEAQRV
jgi:hypothetical protein